MRKLHVTLYPSAFDPNGSPQHVEWKDFIEMRHTVKGAATYGTNRALLEQTKDGPCIVLGRILDGLRRSKQNVDTCSLIGLDLDGKNDEQIKKVFDELSACEFFAYTTHKHKAEVINHEPRWRVFLPLSRDCSVAEAEATWKALAKRLGTTKTDGAVDPQCGDASRLHYLPSTYDEDVAEVRHNKGIAIDPEEVKAPAKEKRPKPKESTEPSNQKRWDIYGKVASTVRVMPKEHPLKEKLQAMLAGESLADEGTRHNTVLELTMWLALYVKTELSEDMLEDLFENSMRAMWGFDADLSEVFDAYRGARGKLDERKEAERAAFEEEAQEVRQKLQAAVSDKEAEPYTEEERLAICEREGFEDNRTRDRWIIQREGASFLLGPDRYHGPYTEKDIRLAANKHLARAGEVELISYNPETQKTRRRGMSEIVLESGQVAEEYIVSLVAQAHRFEPATGTFIEAARPIRPELKPTHDPLIEEWIRQLAGENAERVFDWLACAPDLDKILCAIYFGGAPGAGKSLFGHGVGKLWTKGPPTPIKSILGNFNDELTRCPLIFADDNTTNNKWEEAGLTHNLRELLSVSSRSLQRKYVGATSLQGYVRLLLAANNEFLLKAADLATANDISAVAERFLYIDVPQSATDWFQANVDHKTVQHWLNKGIAEYTLHLAETRVVPFPERRFWVEGTEGRYAEILITSSFWNSLTCEWLVRYLDKPNRGNAKSLVIDEGGKSDVLVNVQAIIDGWGTYLNTQRKIDPNTQKLNAALRCISVGEEKRKPEGKTANVRYWKVSRDILATWSEMNQIGDPAKIRGEV